MTAGLATGANLVEYLGTVSRAVAIKGVEVVAPIAAHSSVTFAFDAEAAGTYTLQVKYTGEGLSLKANGSPGITPGPAGSTTTLELPIKTGLNAITASDLGDGKVVVDWELFLNAGVGQAVAPAPASAATPLPSPALPVGPAAPAPVAAPSPFGASTVSDSMIGSGGMVGTAGPSLPLSPVSPSSNALAYSGDGLPAGLLESPSWASISDKNSSAPELAVEIFGDVRRDVEALALPAWIDRLAAFQKPAAAVGQAVAVVSSGSADERGEGDEEGTVDVADLPRNLDREGVQASVASPALVVGFVVAAAIGRRWRPDLGLAIKRRPTTLFWSWASKAR